MLNIQAVHIANDCANNQCSERSITELMEALALARVITINSEYVRARKNWLQRALNIARELERR